MRPLSISYLVKGNILTLCELDLTLQSIVLLNVELNI